MRNLLALSDVKETCCCTHEQTTGKVSLCYVHSPQKNRSRSIIFFFVSERADVTQATEK